MKKEEMDPKALEALATQLAASLGKVKENAGILEDKAEEAKLAKESLEEAQRNHSKIQDNFAKAIGLADKLAVAEDRATVAEKEAGVLREANIQLHTELTESQAETKAVQGKLTEAQNALVKAGTEKAGLEKSRDDLKSINDGLAQELKNALKEKAILEDKLKKSEDKVAELEKLKGSKKEDNGWF